MDQNAVEGFEPLQYWAQDEQRRVQKQYVAMCLLMAAIQDALLGRVEQRLNNLNWSATISYYSLVHSGRLISFCALGDYPTRHNKLKSLFGGDQGRLDWLSKHRELAGDAAADQSTATRASLVERLGTLGLHDALARTASFGDLLSTAAQLRNDSNYEALLVAHEYDHDVVSEAFRRLAAAMASAAETGLAFAIDSFNALRRNNDVGFVSPIEALMFSFFHDRVVPALNNKIQGNRKAEELLRDIEQRLEMDRQAPRNAALEENLKMTFFTGKTRLMERFNQRVADLEAASAPRR